MGLIIAYEGPCQDGHWPREHALDEVVSHTRRGRVPTHRHRMRARDITEENRRAHTARTITLHPTIRGGEITIELFREVLHHVIALWLTMDQHVQAQLFLALNDSADLGKHRRLVIIAAQITATQLRSGAANICSLWEGANGCRRQLRQF